MQVSWGFRLRGSVMARASPDRSGYQVVMGINPLGIINHDFGLWDMKDIGWFQSGCR